MEKTWRYDAFISYRHTELDSFVAKNLHRQLESFKLPGNVTRKLQKDTEGAKTRITRVFRDQEELPLVSNLADPIMEALEQSEFLIVICSPRLKESIWCKKEIETFIELHGREHILLVLVEGEPADSFPEELLYRQVEETAGDGSIIVKKVPVEPLAADVRGNSMAQVRKKIKTESLRLLAPMFGCGYDDLRQRHRERKMRRIIAASLAGSAVCLSFGLVSTTMALRIRRQNLQITEQSAEIKEQSEAIAAQAEEIEKQYAQAVRNNCISQAQASSNLLEKGDRISAIETALGAFPGGKDADIPYTAQAAYALTESLNVYENGRQILPDRILEADTTIDFMMTSPEGSRVLAVDSSNVLCIWNGADGEKVASILLDKNLYRDEEEIVFLDEDFFLYPSDWNAVSCYDINSGENVYQIACDDFFEMCYSKENDRVVITTDTGFVVIRGQTGETVAAGSWQESQTAGGVPESGNEADNKMEIKDGAVMSGDGTLFAAALSSEAENLIMVYEAETGELHRRYTVASSNVDAMKFSDNVLYVIDNDEFLLGSSFLDDSGSTVYACDLAQNDAVLWTYRNETEWYYDISVSSRQGSSYMVCSSYDSVIVLDKRDGSYVDSFFTGSEIVKLANYIGKDAFLVFTRDGTWHYINLDSMLDLVGTAFSNCTSTNVKMFETGDYYYATLPYLDKKITLYRSACGSSLETLCGTENTYAHAALSPDGAYLAVSEYVDGYTTYVEMIQTDTGEVIWSYEDDSYVDGFSFYPEKEAFTLITNDGIHLFDVTTGEQKAFYEIEDSTGSYLSTDATGRYVFIRGYWAVYGYDLEDGSMAYQLEQEELSTEKSVMTISPYRKYLAVTSVENDSLQLYSLDSLQNGEVSCMSEMKNMNAAYVDYLFFNDKEDEESGKDSQENSESLTLYVVYKNGDMTAYPIYNAETGSQYIDDTLTVKYQDMGNLMTHFIRPENADYSILAGNQSAYLIENGEGEITAHINGFLAADGEKNCIYLTDGTYIYRTPVYDAAMLRTEAEAQLGY